MKMYIATKTNETNTRKKSSKKARFRCIAKVITLYLSISKCFIFCFTHIF